MGYDYNLEEAIQKIPLSIEEVTGLKDQQLPAFADQVRDIAKDVGSDQLTHDCEALCTTLEGMRNLTQQMLGEEGDSVATATMHGLLASAKNLNVTLNGG